LTGGRVADDLFASAAREELSKRAPLAARLRPTTLDEIVGQDHVLGPGKPLRVLIERDRLSSAIVWGPAGTGKTTLANVIARATAKAFVALSAVTATVKDIRETVAAAQDRLGQHGQGTILFLDEVHRFNKAQQDALLPAVETGVLVLIGATTENPFFEVNPPLLSRSTLFRLEPLDDEAIAELLRRGLALEKATVTDEALAHLITIANGDGRHALTTLEVAIVLAASRNSTTSNPLVELVDVEAAAGAKSLRYGEDEHYDVISAFIKSIRGSDVDAGLYWLARMLEAGEDARFIARRLVILASEDIGMAYSTSLLVADAAAHAVEFVGLPEAQLNLAHAVVHLATAPKSNRSYLALSRAQEAARHTRGAGLVPGHLRDAHYKGAAQLGHGKGYVYPHDDPTGWVAQNYRPAEVADDVYYEPSDHGDEAVIAARLEGRRHERQEDSDERD
jgi:putative ATPase